MQNKYLKLVRKKEAWDNDVSLVVKINLSICQKAWKSLPYQSDSYVSFSFCENKPVLAMFIDVSEDSSEYY